jgi:FlaA1/EpsC-like NDP-sugar epimerase
MMLTEMTDKTVFITGACSFVGKSLLRFLLENNVYRKIIACCRSLEKTTGFEKEPVEFVTADLTNPETYLSHFKKYRPDHVIHLAAMARYRQGEEAPELTMRTNFLGSVALLDLAGEYKVEKFLYVSSNLARNPKGITGFSKYLTEAYIQYKDLDTDVVSVRLPNVIDSPGAVTLIFKKQIEEGSPITITDERMSRKFITPEAAAHQLIFVLEHGKNKDIFINNRPSTPIVELAWEMIRRSGKEIPVKFIGMRPGEKLQEEDYPEETVKRTSHPELFLLTENQHTKNQVEEILKKTGEKTGKTFMEEINKVLHF